MITPQLASPSHTVSRRPLALATCLWLALLLHGQHATADDLFDSDVSEPYTQQAMLGVPDYLPLNEAVQQAAIVARVRIRDVSPLVDLAGRALGEVCGRRYVAEVVESFKGERGVIEFAGPALTMFGERAEEYLVFVLHRPNSDARMIRQALGWMVLEDSQQTIRWCRVHDGYFLPETPQLMLPIIVRRRDGIERREIMLAGGTTVAFCGGFYEDRPPHQPSRYQSRSEVFDGTRLTYVGWDGISSVLGEATSLASRFRYWMRRIPEAPDC